MITYYNAGNYYGDEYRKYLVNNKQFLDLSYIKYSQGGKILRIKYSND